MTLRVATLYHKLISGQTNNVNLVSLKDVDVCERNNDLMKLEKDILIPTEKFVIVMPEYNGSIPGILKLMIDNSDIKKVWWFKKVMLVGVADGRAGNLRGLDHMTNILHYLKMHILYNKLPISRINEEIDKDGRILKPETNTAINQQIDEFLKF